MKTLERISIAGFKSIRELRDFEIHQLNVLVGANGVGKTNFISLFKFLNYLVERRLQIFVAQSGGAEVFLHFGRKVTNQISAKLKFSEKGLANGYDVNLIPGARGNLIFADERYWFHDLGRGFRDPLVEMFGFGHEETRLPETQSDGKAKYVLSALQSCKVYHFHDTSESARVKQIGDIGDNARLRP